MPTPQIVDTAQRRPGGDFLTGDDHGPFLDTGIDLGSGKGRYGNRIYLSLKHLAPPLRDIGWLPAEDAAETVDELGRLRAEVEKLREVERRYQELVKEISAHVEPREVERVVVKEVSRPPTEEELTAHVLRHRSALLRSETRGSDEHYRAVYKDSPYLVEGRRREQVSTADEGPTEEQDPQVTSPSAEEGDTDTPGIASSVVELKGHEVDLDTVLDGNAKEVLSYAKGQPEEFIEALVEREYALGESRGKPHPRKGVIEGLGYEYEVEDADE